LRFSENIYRIGKSIQELNSLINTLHYEGDFYLKEKSNRNKEILNLLNKEFLNLLNKEFDL